MPVFARFDKVVHINEPGSAPLHKTGADSVPPALRTPRPRNLPFAAAAVIDRGAGGRQDAPGFSGSMSMTVCSQEWRKYLWGDKAMDELDVGDEVLAHWASADAYFVGTVAEKRKGALLVVFEDGDVGVIDRSRVVRNHLGKGAQVFARWRDGRYYAGRIDRIKGRALYISYDDGDGRWVPWSAIAVKSVDARDTAPGDDP